MSMNGLFILLALGLGVGLAVVALMPWWRGTLPRMGLLALGVSAFQSRLDELEADHAARDLSDDDYRIQKQELQRQLLAASAGVVTLDAQTDREVRVPRLLMIMVGCWIPCLAFLLYFGLPVLAPQFQTDRDIRQQLWQVSDQYHTLAEDWLSGHLADLPDALHEHPAAVITAMQANLYRYVLDALRWQRLSQAYAAIGMTDAALDAIDHAHRLQPDDPEISLADARMRFLIQQGRIDPAVPALLTAVLEKNPQHEGALMLMSMVTFRDQDYAAAIHWLTQLKAVRQARATPDAPADPVVIAQLDQAIAQATQAQTSTVKNQVSTALVITVQLPASLWAQVQPESTLFVFARALQGSPAPYAVVRMPAHVLLESLRGGQPLTVHLSDADHMLAGQTLSSAQRDHVPLVVAARISRSGQPLPMAKDMESLPQPLKGAETRYTLNIDQIHP